VLEYWSTEMMGCYGDKPLCGRPSRATTISAFVQQIPLLHYSDTPTLRFRPYPFVAPAVNPPRQYLPNATNAISSGKTLTNEPMAIKLKTGLPPAL
jgi:hypothetical protein